MRFLLDTHAFLWFVLDDRRLSERAKALIATPENNVEISPATYWEIAIKIRLGKYSLSEPADQFFDRQVQINRFQILHIQPRHVGPLTSLPFHHRDPQIPVVTEDALFASYPI